jgi:hypothetical protein
MTKSSDREAERIIKIISQHVGERLSILAQVLTIFQHLSKGLRINTKQSRDSRPYGPTLGSLVR